MFVSGHVGSKKIVSAAYNFRSHYKQLFGLRNFRRLGPNVFFEISGANCSSCKHFRRVVIWRFVARADPYQNTEDGLNRFISDCAGHLRTWPEIVIFTRCHVCAPLQGGQWPPATPIIYKLVEGYKLYKCVWLLASTRARLLTHGTTNSEHTSIIRQIHPSSPQTPHPAGKILCCFLVDHGPSFNARYAIWIYDETLLRNTLSRIRSDFAVKGETRSGG